MPNSQIPLTRTQDIQVDDAELRQQFQELFNAGQFQQAISLLNDSQYQDQLDSKKYVAKIINQITAGIVYLESLYDTNVTVFLSTLAQQYNVLISNFRNRGAFSSSNTYVPYNFVTYDGAVYMCIQSAPQGTLPTNQTYWLYLGLQGPQGLPGVDVTMQFDYAPDVQYHKNDLVVIGNTIYVALQDNINSNPQESTDDWMVFIAFNPGGINVGTVPPASAQNNTIWFQTQVDPLTYIGTEPIIGIFKRYVLQYGIWEEMYPETVFEWIDDTEDYVPDYVEVELTILTTDWSNLQFTYSNSVIQDNSVVTILPVSTINDQQYKDYSKMKVSVGANNSLVFIIDEAPTTNIPIRINIII